MLTELDVVNDMLASMGEQPLNAIDEDHPLVASAVRILRIANAREQAKSWWFNREIVVIKPDPETGFSYVPGDTLSIDPVSAWTHLVQRGRRLYDPRGRAYLIGRDVTVHLIREVPFDDLPAMAQAYVSLAAQEDFQKAYDADRLKYEQIIRQKQEAFLVLRAEDIRNAGVNLLYTPSNVARMNDLHLTPFRGTRYYVGAIPGLKV